MKANNYVLAISTSTVPFTSLSCTKLKKVTLRIKGKRPRIKTTKN